MVETVGAKYVLHSHMDIVRGVSFVPELEALATVSEDCTVKLWSLKNIEQSHQELDGNLEPYITLRGHTGPLFAVTHSRTSKFLYTAGTEGVIRVWSLPSLSDVNPYGDTFDGRNYCIGQWVEASGESFWDIRHHNYQSMLLAVNASPEALVWDTKAVEAENQENNGKVLVKVKNPEEDIPTTCTWVEANHS